MRAKPQFRMMLGAALAVLAMTAVAATAAQAATEGPFYKISGTRLASGESRAVTLSARENLKIAITSLGQVITCARTSVTGGKLAGSTGANSAGSEGTLKFESCSQTGNGSECEVENGVISTTALKGTLGYVNATRTGRLVELFKPVTGKTFMSIEYTGAGCKWTKRLVEGAIIDNLGSNASPVEVGKEKAATTAVLGFQNTTKAIWTETGGTLTEVKPTGLNSSGFGVTLQGEDSLQLEGLPEWGVFTK